jgi:hypothetical protein
VFPSGRESMLATYFVVLAAGRILAWWLILVVGYFGSEARPSGIALALVPAVVLSYVVEIPILIGLIGAIGIC